MDPAPRILATDRACRDNADLDTKKGSAPRTGVYRSYASWIAADQKILCAWSEDKPNDIVGMITSAS
jgi:hypothetical protein